MTKYGREREAPGRVAIRDFLKHMGAFVDKIDDRHIHFFRRLWICYRSDEDMNNMDGRLGDALVESPWFERRHARGYGSSPVMEVVVSSGLKFLE